MSIDGLLLLYICRIDLNQNWIWIGNPFRTGSNSQRNASGLPKTPSGEAFAVSIQMTRCFHLPPIKIVKISALIWPAKRSIFWDLFDLVQPPMWINKHFPMVRWSHQKPTPDAGHEIDLTFEKTALEVEICWVKRKPWHRVKVQVVLTWSEWSSTPKIPWDFFFWIFWTWNDFGLYSNWFFRREILLTFFMCV